MQRMGKSKKQMGRPPKWQEPYKRTTLELPVRLLKAIKDTGMKYGDFFTEVGYNDPRIQEQLRREEQDNGEVHA